MFILILRAFGDIQSTIALVGAVSVDCDCRKHQPWSATDDRLVGLVVRRPPQERKIPGSNPACAGIFFRGRVIPVT